MDVAAQVMQEAVAELDAARLEGREAMTMTVNLNINFFRPGAPVDVIADVRLHRVGKRLATGDVLMYSEGDTDPIAQATVTYAIPSR